MGSGNSQVPFHYQIPTLYLKTSESVKSALELSSRLKLFLLLPILLLVHVLGVKFTFFGAEGNSSGDCHSCSNHEPQSVSASSFLSCLVTFLLNEVQKGLDFFRLIFIHVPF